jgi:hypothetical protein
MSSTTNFDSILAALKNLTEEVESLRSTAQAKPEAPAPKPKKALNPEIVAMNLERKAIFEEMKAGWARSYPEAASLSKEDLKKAIAQGKIAKPPTYPDALKEHSRRRRAVDPLHNIKAQERRDALDLLQQELHPAWKSNGCVGPEPTQYSATKELRRRRGLTSQTSSVVEASAEKSADEASATSSVETKTEAKPKKARAKKASAPAPAPTTANTADPFDLFG